MDLKKTLMKQAMKLAQNPKVLETAMRAIELKGQLSSQVDDASKVVLRSLNLATRDEVTALQRTITRLENELAKKTSPVKGEGDPER